MTTVAFDGLTLAADRAAIAAGVVKTTQKLFAGDGWAAAIVGNLSVGMEMLAWYRAGAVPSDYPAANRSLSEGATLVVASEGRLHVYESSPFAFRVEPPCAFGSGAAAAMGAMLAGADAVDAVSIACQVDDGSGRGVDHQFAGVSP